ncbi:hypothetical protein [Zhihengliuella flava]|uniref:Terminase n=1 Tax=Zhihengliuella flava TaxID=1285193 RepID=A0A931DAQ9_9MICC|nr:hypothetical protein [Zhihengliuella flava]MBG6083250.1 hypothetical protein [Zhihengliuella flava]
MATKKTTTTSKRPRPTKSGELRRPPGLGKRGAKIWQELATEDPVRNSVVLEAARTADRLDELDSVIRGKGVLELMQFRSVVPKEDDLGDDRLTVEVKFQSVLGEARQQSLAFAQLLKSLGLDSKAAEVNTRPETELPENVTPFERVKQRR